MRQTIAILLTVVVVVLAAESISQARDVPFTQEDRDRIVRLEGKLEDGLKIANQRIDEGLKATNQRIDDLRVDMKNMKSEIMTVMIWGFGVLFSGMWILMGFVLWDRRTALVPAIRKTKEVYERSELIVEVLKELAAKNPDVREALKHRNLL
ncbi:MAG: hypothetical protein HQL06_05280 [Nitrospirae bacterium]|nr:hypothetical protein [Nitrospirota bacterium]